MLRSTFWTLACFLPITMANAQPRTIASLTKDQSPRGSHNAASGGNPNIFVSKTAQVVGHEICGRIRITNLGFNAAAVASITDNLEVHFQNNIPPTPLPVGASPNWFIIANVPIQLPGPIAPRTTANINYCFSLCQAADYTGANSMRNAATVRIAKPTGGTWNFPTLSNNFSPPFPDCQACCLTDGTCTDTAPARCLSAGGVAQGPHTDCANTECPEACCRPDDSCSDDAPSVCQAAGGEPKGPGTDCASTLCCAPSGVSNACSQDTDCCNSAAHCIGGTCCISPNFPGCILNGDCCVEGQTCEAGTCCAPLRVANTCQSSGDCCTPGGKCLNGECCILPDDSGCTIDSDCCVEGQTCEGGTCCAPLRVANTCQSSGDCCTPGGKCLNGECCILPDDFGCTIDSDCCVEGQICEAGTCCAPLRVANTCQSSGDCCTPGGKCLNGECCILTGDSGCNSDGDCCTDGQTCVFGTCCRDLFGSCDNDFDCCSGLVCTAGTCDMVISP